MRRCRCQWTIGRTLGWPKKHTKTTQWERSTGRPSVTHRSFEPWISGFPPEWYKVYDRVALRPESSPRQGCNFGYAANRWGVHSTEYWDSAQVDPLRPIDRSCSASNSERTYDSASEGSLLKVTWLTLRWHWTSDRYFSFRACAK